MTPNYNSTALFYDRLSRILFGNALNEAQVYLLKYIPPGAKVIIAGGGTGLILEELSKLHSYGLNVTYVEMAQKMMEISMKRFIGTNKVDFINDDIRNISTTNNYDVVITPFLFDNFPEEEALVLFSHIHSLIKPGGLWLYSDFQLTGRWWQTALLRSMLIFFRILCNVRATTLPGIAHRFSSNGYLPVAQKTFFSDFVISVVYKRPTPFGSI